MRDEGLPLCPISRATERYTVVHTFLQLVRLLHNLYLPNRPAGSSMESVAIAAAVFLGHVEGKPFTISKLSLFLGLAPTTVRRKLQPLIAGGVVERRRDGTYAMAEPRVNSPEVMAKVDRTVAVLFLSRRKIERATNQDALGATRDLEETQDAP
jgi:DNA-binding transcriptional ArsR family regulator